MTRSRIKPVLSLVTARSPLKTKTRQHPSIDAEIPPITQLPLSYKLANPPLLSFPGLGVQTLMCFSLYHNGWKLLATKQGPGTIRCLNGIRFISMTWVILGHSVLFAQYTLGKQWLTTELLWEDREVIALSIGGEIAGMAQ